jgi:hypothetical protein
MNTLAYSARPSVIETKHFVTLKPGGEPRGWQVQEGDCRRRSELSPPHPRRRGSPGVTGTT